jgi:hypothetical protein
MLVEPSPGQHEEGKRDRPGPVSLEFPDISTRHLLPRAFPWRMRGESGDWHAVPLVRC